MAMNSREKNERSRLRLILTNLTHQTKEFFSNSTLHGVRYINENGRAFGEKFMWFCCVAIGSVAALIIIDSLWEKFQTNPTITGLDTDFHNQELAFPTVVICPILAYSDVKVNETMLKHNFDEDDTFRDFLMDLALMTYKNIGTISEKISDDVKTKMKTLDVSLRELVFDISVNCEDLLSSCSFRGENMSCCENFHRSYNEQGFCYSFNGRYISTPTGEIRSKSENKIMETDKHWELEFGLKTQSRVYLHSTEDVTGNDILPLFDWTSGEYVNSLISMKQTYTTEDAEQLTVGQRKCIFENERNVDYFKNDIYSLTVCMIKCRMQKAQKLCKCTPPFYAPEVGKDKFQKCTVEDLMCLQKYHKNITNINGCSHCELSCFSNVYETEKFSHSAIQLSEEEEMTEPSQEMDFKVSIEFLSWPIIRYKKEVLFGFVDLLVSFGGIAGLFLGFSLLSGIEVLYYFTMRACCMFVKNREQLYELQKEKDSRPPVIYDLSLQPKFNHNNTTTTTSTRPNDFDYNIKMVKPVEPYNDDGNGNESRLSTRNQALNNLLLFNKQINRPESEFTRDALINMSHARMKRQQQVYPKRKNMFSQLNSDPYTKVMKPLDKQFFNHRQNIRNRDLEHNTIYSGYLP